MTTLRNWLRIALTLLLPLMAIDRAATNPDVVKRLTEAARRFEGGLKR